MRHGRGDALSDAEQSDPPNPEDESERGTAVLALLFISAMAGMWAVVYIVMLERGA